MLDLNPLICEQEVPYILMLASVSAHIEVVQGNDIFWKVVINSFIGSKLPFDSIL